MWLACGFEQRPAHPLTPNPLMTGPVRLATLSGRSRSGEGAGRLRRRASVARSANGAYLVGLVAPTHCGPGTWPLTVGVDAGGTEVPLGVNGFDLDDVSGVRRDDYLPMSQVDPKVVDALPVAGVGGPEPQVTRLELTDARVRPSLVLLSGGSGQGDSG